jgi:monofunctional biosynthetic peptidoglycan transglycosylase
VKKHLWRGLGLLLLCTVCLQGVFIGRIALMNLLDPQSTSFQRSEAWRLLSSQGPLQWSQSWADEAALSSHLKRAVIASEDAGFTEHSGVEWESIEKAWERNQKNEARAEKLQTARNPPKRPPSVRLVGGSTISQQLAKNLFLSSERTLLRKAQEFLLTFYLEMLLSKRRILVIYLNNVEWGEGVFGAQAAARHYFRTDAARLSPAQAARLAVMLPAPKRFEKRPASPYLLGRAQAVMAGMGDVALP